MVENPPLARALHATVEIDDEIPVEHYQAVAEVIGYVMRLQARVFGRLDDRRLRNLCPASYGVRTRLRS